MFCFVWLHHFSFSLLVISHSTIFVVCKFIYLFFNFVFTFLIIPSLSRFVTAFDDSQLSRPRTFTSVLSVNRTRLTLKLQTWTRCSLEQKPNRTQLKEVCEWLVSSPTTASLWVCLIAIQKNIVLKTRVLSFRLVVCLDFNLSSFLFVIEICIKLIL